MDPRGNCSLNIDSLDSSMEADILLGTHFFAKYDFAHKYGDRENYFGQIGLRLKKYNLILF